MCGGACGHDHETGEDTIILKHIAVDKVRGLNTAGKPEDLRAVFKNYDNRTSDNPSVSSYEDDPEMIIHIPFTEQVKLRSFCIVGGGNGDAPSRVKLFVNSDNLDFSDAEDRKAAQEFDLVEDFEGELWYKVNRNKFQNINSLCIYIPDNHEGDKTTISYIGLKGEGTGVKKGVVHCKYEAIASVKDHKKLTEDNMGSSVL